MARPKKPTSTPSTYVTGTLRLHPKGFGFVVCDDKLKNPQDIFIPRHLTLHAIDGDKVEVAVRGDVISDKGPEGKIVAILERSRTHLAGTIRGVDKNGDYTAYAPLLGQEKRVVVLPDETPLKEGDRVVLRVQEWGTKSEDTLCHVDHVIGHISDPSCDIDAAIEEFQLRDAFPHDVVDEAKGWGTRVRPGDIAQRTDLRDEVCVTIDPDTAKDFDDALGVTRDANGHYHLSVHIADVSHYVRPGSALDTEAKQRCNSTYFPGRCLPMLPPALSNELCSLKPNVNRLAVTVKVEFSPDGEEIGYQIFRSVIKSRKRFTYGEAKAVLDGKRKSPYAPLLKEMETLCLLLKKKRYARGSIEFSMPELVVLCDEGGLPYGTDIIPYDITHQLVEEFMLKANETVARHLAEHGKNLSFRVHEEPSEENIRDFALLATALGFAVSPQPTVQELQGLFDKAAESHLGPHLATNYIRKMRLAVYSPDNIGHYGLSLSHYTHFTSPIRRYIDLVIHRILFGDEHEWDHLEEISTLCSEQERVSAKAEGTVVLLKKLRLIELLEEEEPHRGYPAMVTKVAPFGLFFEVVDLMLEGFVHISELGNDYFIVDEEAMEIRGRDTGATFAVGDPLTAGVQALDTITLEHKWHLFGEPRSERGKKKGKGKKSGKFRRKGKRR